IPESYERSRISREVFSSAWLPKVIVPMQMSETTMPLRPSRFFFMCCSCCALSVTMLMWDTFRRGDSRIALPDMAPDSIRAIRESPLHRSLCVTGYAEIDYATRESGEPCGCITVRSAAPAQAHARGESVDGQHDQQHDEDDRRRLRLLEQAEADIQHLAEAAGADETEDAGHADIIFPAIQRIGDQLRPHAR